MPLTVDAPGYSGPATLQLFDGAGRRFATLPLAVTDGRASASLTVGGALGPHAATLLVGGKIAGIANTLYTLDAQTSLSTGVADIDTLYPRTHSLQDQSVSEYVIDGAKLRGYRSPDSDLIWLRDHVQQARGYRYFERDMTSALDAFRHFQHDNGSFDDFLANPPWGLIRGRMDVEADVEYLYALGVYQAWQASGDDAWLRQSLPAAERGIAYSTSDPQRWEPTLRMIKRPLTVDTWDYEYGGPDYTQDGKAIGRHRIDDRTIWGIMHGDNSGMAQSMNVLANAFAYLGDAGKAASYRARAADLTAQLNALCWNGSFYRHRLPLTAFRVPGVDEDKQLSLSNAFALNRGVLDTTQATAILNEYQYRRIANPAVFAEWYSIDPPFPPNSFGTGATWGDTPGTYTNGGVLPLVGGELARGAFRWGQPGYGFDILGRYRFMLERQGGGYLWYYPQGNPGISGKETVAHDGWGASAMLAALFEGAAGVVDEAVLLKQVTISPAWSADTRVTSADVTVRYPASFGYLSYHWQRQADSLSLTVTGTLEHGKARLLLPEKADTPRRVQVDGVAVPVQVEELGKSRYVVVDLQPGITHIDIS